MRSFALLLVVAIFAAAAFAAPGDILRSQSLTGQPSYGVRGLAKDWDTGDVWVAGPNYMDDIIYTTMDPATMDVGTWLSASGQYWLFDMGYGYDDGGTLYLLMNDQNSPFTKEIDPADGSYDGSLPDYYSSSEYTDGCAVDWDNNYVYLSSYASSEVVYYDGSSFNLFDTIAGGKNMGTAVGWGHLFVIRTDSYYTIEIYQLDGTFVESLALNGYPTNQYLMGLACGQEDAVGDNESLFFADFITYRVHEVEVDNYTTSLQHSTWGAIKAGFSE